MRFWGRGKPGGGEVRDFQNISDFLDFPGFLPFQFDQYLIPFLTAQAEAEEETEDTGEIKGKAAKGKF